ncbi:MAG: rhodanese-like domain-containing protein [Candidatus Phosphoribacter sp.]|nr:rhodanese-like domain-containing protein [Actinomycetales bacterium]
MTHRRTTAVLAAAVAALGLGLSGCSTSAGTAPAGGLASVAPAAAVPSNGARVDAAAFAAALKLPGTVLLDVRTPAEFADGHLAGAINIDVSAADFSTKVGALAKGVPYAVYCRTGSRSGNALSIMKGLGFTSAYHLDGGITSWSSAGGTVVKG